MSTLKAPKAQKYKVIFIGTSEFAVPILKSLISCRLSPVAIVTQPDKKVGRKQEIKYSPVKKLALKHKISPILQPERIIEAKPEIERLEPDLIIVAAFGQIIPKEILDIPKKGCLNIHPSLLPKYRGPSPIQSVILAGEKVTGVTIILMDEKIDHGPIIQDTRYKIQDTRLTYKELLEKLADLGAELLIETIPRWMEGKIKPKPQDEKKATYTKILRKEDGQIDWQKNAEDLERQIRAFDTWPKSYTYIKSKILKILEVDVINSESDKQKGEVFLTNKKQLAVQTGKGQLKLEEVQLEGRSPMKARDFLNGYPQIIGVIFS